MIRLGGFVCWVESSRIWRQALFALAFTTSSGTPPEMLSLILLPLLNPNQIRYKNDGCVIKGDEANEDPNVAVTIGPLIAVLCVL